MTALTGLVITALVLVVAHGGWGLIWLLVPALLIARRSICSLGLGVRESLARTTALRLGSGY
jgi:hypothetical protein